MIDIELEQAIELLNTFSCERKVIDKDLLMAIGDLCAKDIYAPMNNPPFDRSPVDGYAVKSNDTRSISKENNIVLSVIGNITAGECFHGCLQKGQAIRIMTGAPIPDGADCVVRQEDTDYGMNEVSVYRSMNPYENYCLQGEDIEEGICIITKGTKIGYEHVGILATLGISKISVIQPLSIGLITTGDELVDITQELSPGKIYNSNRYLLTARLYQLGIQVRYIDHCPDSVEAVTEAIEEAIKQVDILITTGGVSVGVKDIMQDAITALNARQLFWRINIKPGTPVLVAEYKDRPIISLSGNPFAALAIFEVFVRPFLATITYDCTINIRRTTAILTNDFNKKSEKRRLIRGYFKDGQIEILQMNHSSGAILSLIKCNAFIDIDSGTERLEKGHRVNVILL